MNGKFLARRCCALPILASVGRCGHRFAVSGPFMELGRPARRLASGGWTCVRCSENQCACAGRRCGRGEVDGLCRRWRQRLRARFNCGARGLSSFVMADRIIAWTVDSSSRAICWSCRFIDFGMRTARKTTSSSTVCFLAAGTAMPSPVLGTRTGRSHGLLHNYVVRVLPLDLSVILHDHLIKRSRSSRDELISSNFSSFRKGVWP